MASDQRPLLSPELTGPELARWYWLKNELAEFARALGIRSTGSKDLLAQRISAALDDRPFTEPTTPKRSTNPQLTAPLTLETVIPAGQRCSQIVRAWFVDQVGASFSFDAEMRDYFANADGTQTMAGALTHYRATRGLRPKEISAQFEYNRFTRAWHESHPGESREDLLAAWQVYRSRPADQRG